jgi:predicted enzyme related to lactoylglutathione lyase
MSKLCHWDIPSTDLETSKKFYGELFGWEFQQWSDDYALFSVEDGVGGGFMKVESMPAPGIVAYVEVEDIDATLEKAVELGGKVAQPKTEIGEGMGYMASLEDSQGGHMGLWSQS